MQITIINNSADPKVGPGERTVAAGTTEVFTGRTDEELRFYVGLLSSATVQVVGDIEDADVPALVCTMKTPTIIGGDDAVAAVGFDITYQGGGAYSTTTPMYVGAFSDAAFTTPHATAVFKTPATGTITSGVNTNTILVAPVGGVFSCTLDDSAAGTVYVKAWQGAASELSIDTSDSWTATFSGMFVTMKTPASPAEDGGGTVLLTGFQYTATAGGASVSSQLSIKLEAFDDALFATPSIAATLDTATTGTITATAGTNSITVTPSATGEFACSLLGGAAGTVYVKCTLAVAGDLVDITDFETDVFTDVYVQMKNPGDPGGGIDFIVGVGFDILDGPAGAPVATQVPLQVDVTLSGLLSAATVGVIDTGTGTATIGVTPDAAGEFSCRVDDSVNETVDIVASALNAADAPLITVSAADTVAFT